MRAPRPLVRNTRAPRRQGFLLTPFFNRFQYSQRRLWRTLEKRMRFRCKLTRKCARPARIRSPFFCAPLPSTTSGGWSIEDTIAFSKTETGRLLTWWNCFYGGIQALPQGESHPGASGHRLSLPSLTRAQGSRSRPWRSPHPHAASGRKRCRRARADLIAHRPRALSIRTGLTMPALRPRSRPRIPAMAQSSMDGGSPARKPVAKTRSSK